MFKFTPQISCVQLAIVSRLLIILLQFISNILLPDHDAGAFTAPHPPPESGQNISKCDVMIETFFNGFRRWDAEYFLHIAENGYTYENTLAFYPLYPMSIRFLTNALDLMTSEWLRCSYRSLLLITAVSLNIFFFTMAAKSLQRLTILVFNDQFKAKIVTILFCFNPASIFFSAPYTESVFSWLTFQVMGKCAQMRIKNATIPLCLSILCRSNGMLNIGFVIFYAMTNLVRNVTWLEVLKTGTKIMCVILCVSITFSIQQLYYYLLYCTNYKTDLPKWVENYGREHKFVMLGDTNSKIPPWCSKALPLSYSYIQSHYWNVGFLTYYEIKQIPNFLLAFPILFIFILSSLIYFNRNRSTLLSLGLRSSSKAQNEFVFIVHGFILSVFCLFCVHIQVSTRMLASSSPCLYWFAANCYSDKYKNTELWHFFNPRNFAGKLIRTWFLSYYVIGTILFCNFLPWT